MDLENCAHRAPEMSFANRPSGFRRLTPGLLKADRAAEAFAGLPAGVTAHGQLLAAFKAAAPRLGLSARLVHAVDWLFRFTQAQDWERGRRPIVWPSAETQQAALILSPTQAKAINRMLIEAGLLTMRDSPNGKRYGHRDRQGRIVEAYGFDLSPLAARHDEFLCLAEDERQERQEMGQLRRRTTIARRGIAQILETVREYGLAGDEWQQLAQETQRAVGMLRNARHPEHMESGVVSLEVRQAAAREHLEALLETVDSAPRAPENRPHILATTELENPSDTVAAPRRRSSHGQAPRTGASPTPSTPASSVGTAGFKLSAEELIRLAPRLKDFLRGPDPTWRDVVEAADGLRGELEISKPLWGEACLQLGREAAAVAVAIVSTKEPAHFKTSAGGYFYGMLVKARAGELNLDRTIWKLRNVTNSPGSSGRALSASFRTATYPRPSPGATARVGGRAPVP